MSLSFSWSIDSQNVLATMLLINAHYVVYPEGQSIACFKLLWHNAKNLPEENSFV